MSSENSFKIFFYVITPLYPEGYPLHLQRTPASTLIFPRYFAIGLFYGGGQKQVGLGDQEDLHHQHNQAVDQEGSGLE